MIRNLILQYKLNAVKSELLKKLDDIAEKNYMNLQANCKISTDNPYVVKFLNRTYCTYTHDSYDLRDKLDNQRIKINLFRVQIEKAKDLFELPNIEELDELERN